MLHGRLHIQIALLIRLVLQPDLLAVLARSINFCMSMWKLLCVHCKVTKTNFTFAGPCITIYLLNKDQQGALFFLNLSDSSILYVVQWDELFIIRRHLLHMQHMACTMWSIFRGQGLSIPPQKIKGLYYGKPLVTSLLGSKNSIATTLGMCTFLSSFRCWRILYDVLNYRW